MDMNAAIDLIESGMTPDEAVAFIMEARRVRNPDWTPNRGSAAHKALEVVLLNPGLSMKTVASMLGKTTQSTYRALVGNQDAGLLANLGGKRGYVITDKGIQVLEKLGTAVPGKIPGQEMIATASAAAGERKLPTEITAAEDLRTNLGDIVSTSSLGKRTRGVSAGSLGTAYSKKGDQAVWTVTLQGAPLGGQFEEYSVWIGKTQTKVRILKNPAQIESQATSRIQDAVSKLGIQGGISNVGVVGWQAAGDSGDVVVQFTSAKIPEPEKPSKEELKRSRRREPSRMVKRAQRLLKRAAKGPRLSSVGRAMKLIQKYQNAGK